MRQARQFARFVAALDDYNIVFDDQRAVLLKDVKRLAIIAHHHSDDAVVHGIARGDGVNIDAGFRQRIEVGRSQAALRLKEGDFPAGSYVVRLDQPYRNYAVDLLTPQHFPKEAGEPYDDISWELPAHYRARTRLGVDVLPEDVAEAIAFLASARAAKSTGNVINVDGGVTAAYPR